MTGRRCTMVGAAGSVLVALTLVVTLIIAGEPDTAPPSPVTVDEAERVLDSAVRLAQAGDDVGLCQSVALSEGTCEFLLRAARERGLTPGHNKPQVTGITRPLEERMSLRLRGTYPDGQAYVSEFVVVRARYGDIAGQLRSVTPVYWSPMGDAEGNCTAALGRAGCQVGPATVMAG